MSADPRPSLSESARAALLLDAGVKAALRKLQGCDFCIRGGLCDIVGGDCYTAYCVASALAYSAYLARTPLDGVTLEAPESEVQSWAKILHVRPFVPNVVGQMARDILTLKVHCTLVEKRFSEVCAAKNIPLAEWAALSREVEAARTERSSLQERIRDYEKLVEAVNLSGDGCLPACNSFGHAEDCKTWSVATWLTRQQERIAALTAERDAAKSEVAHVENLVASLMKTRAHFVDVLTDGLSAVCVARDSSTGSVAEQVIGVLMALNSENAKLRALDMKQVTPNRRGWFVCVGCPSTVQCEEDGCSFPDESTVAARTPPVPEDTKNG